MKVGRRYIGGGEVGGGESVERKRKESGGG